MIEKEYKKIKTMFRLFSFSLGQLGDYFYPTGKALLMHLNN